MKYLLFKKYHTIYFTISGYVSCVNLLPIACFLVLCRHTRILYNNTAWDCFFHKWSSRMYNRKPSKHGLHIVLTANNIRCRTHLEGSE